MNKTTKTIVALVLVCVAAASAFFGYDAMTNRKSNEGEQTYAWPLATCSTDETITHVFAQTFADKVAELSDGKMKIQVYPNSTLGGDRELLESCKAGDIPFVVQSPAPQVTFMPELCVFDMPCVSQNIQDMRDAVDNPEFLEIIKGIYEEAGYQFMGIADQVFRVMTSNVEFTSFDSFKGQKIRTMENPYHLQFWKAVGANPTPMTFSEVYIGLQQGTIDAQENAYELIVSAKLYEQQKYAINTNAVPDFTTLIVSDVFFDTLTEEQQNIIREAGQLAQDAARESADDRRADKIAYLEGEGMKVITPDEEAWAKMQEASQVVYDSVREVAGDELVDLYLGLK